jgi:protein-S-isoprenylcysteine O-methyltransferase Ste14
LSENTGDVKKKALAGLTALIVILWIVLFLTAGTVNYLQGWIFWLSFIIGISSISVYFLKKDIVLIASRLKVGTSETDKTQKITQGVIGISFILILLISTLDYRFAWSAIPFYFSLVGDFFVGIGLLLIFLVFRENSYTSVLVEVDSKQKVVSSGPYGKVRHPMYSGALLMLFFIPLALGSMWGLIAFLPILCAIPLRIMGEEKFLMENLKGYMEYCKKVRFRLIPLIW